MSIQYINTGSSANAGNGDSLRSAFVKVNNNFAYLSTASFGGGSGNGYTGSQGDIGYTGSAGNQGNIGYTGSAGISNVNIVVQPESEVGALAFYLTTSTISRAPRIKTDGGVLFIGDKNSPGFLSGLYIENTLSAEGFGRGFTYANHLQVAESNNFTFYRSRGTPLVPTATVLGDEIVDINFLGHNGTTATYGFNITASIDQVPVGGQQPMRLTFAGNNNAGQILSHMIITSTGTVRMYKLGAIGNTTTSISVSTSLVPATDVTHDLGSADRQWRSLYVSSSTIYINRTPLTIDDQGTLLVNGSSVLGTPGYSGSQGLRGYNGSRGDTGYNGSQGDTGFTGSQGLRGYNGSRGDTGYVGSQGDIGYVGSEGTPGLQGNRGYTGSEGAQGTPGLQGLTGEQGVSVVLLGTVTNAVSLPLSANFGEGYITVDTGHVWFWGTASTWNDVGQIVGPQGDQGYTGSQGTQGDTGLTGDTGYTGSTGANGYVGSQGDVGYTGSQGELGYTGSQGDVGYTGSTGSRGLQGYDGSQGDVGYVGSQGDVGYTGSRAQEDRLTTGSYSVILGTDGVLTLPSGNLSISNDSIVGSTGTLISVITEGRFGAIGLQWIDDISSLGSTTTQVQVAGIAVNAPLSSTTGTVQIVTGFSTGSTVSNTWEFGVDGTLTAPGHLLPDADLAYDLGSTSSQWRSIYVGTGTIYIGGIALGVNQDNYVTVDGNPIITVNTAGNITVQGDVAIGTVIISDTAPEPNSGVQWFNTVEARTYIAYNSQWVDASPTVLAPPDTNPTLESVTFNDNTTQTTAWRGTYSYNDLTDKPITPTFVGGGGADTWLTAE